MKRRIYLAGAIIFALMSSSYLLVEGFWLVTGLGPRREVKPWFYENVLGDLEPNLRTVDNTIKGLPFTVTTNSQGFRGTQDIAPEKREGTLRILCLGDSYSYGVGVDDERTFPAFLESMLQKRYPGLDVETVNASVPFFDVFDELDYYRDKGRLLNADVVIVQFFANDLEAMAGQFFRESNKSKLGGRYERMGRGAHMEEISDFLQSLDPGLFAKPPASPKPPAGPSHYARFHIDPTPDERALLDDRDAVLDERNADRLARYWKNYEAGLLLLRDAVEADGARFLFIILPDPRQLLEYRNAPSRVLTPFLKRNGVAFLDFAQIFRKYARQDGSEFFLMPYNEHLSPHGNAVVANIVSEAIEVARPKDGPPAATIDPKERSFSFASPASVLLDISEQGVRQLSGRETAAVDVVEERGLKVIRETLPAGDVFSLTPADPQSPAGGEITLKAEAAWPVGHLSLIVFRRLLHPAGGAVRVSWSLDGKNFTPASIYVSQPDRDPDAFENIRIDEIFFEGKEQKTVYVKIELSGLARVFTQRTDNPLRRLELVFYPVEK